MNEADWNRASDADLETLAPQDALDALYARQAKLGLGLIGLHTAHTVGEMIASLPPDRREKAAELLKGEERDAPVIESRTLSLGSFELVVVKHLGRPLRRLGVPGTRPGCFLCNPPPSQLALRTAGHVALANPYPVFDGQITLAFEDHNDQETMGAAELARVLADVLELGRRCPRYFGALNGPSCGASIPGHLHFNLAPCRLPIFDAPTEEIGTVGCVTTSVVGGPWPNLVVVHEGPDPRPLADRLVREIRHWVGCNVIFHVRRGALRAFCVPRMRRNPRGFAGAWAYSEVCGRFVCESTADFRAMTDVTGILDGLACVGVPRGAREVVY